MLTAATDPDDAATAAKLAAILEEPPRGGNSDPARRLPASSRTGSSGRSSFEAAGQPRWSARCTAPGAAAGAGICRPDRPSPRSGRALSARQRDGAMLDADDALGRHEWLIAPLLLQEAPRRTRGSSGATAGCQCAAGAVPRVGAAFRYRRMG